jgi:hypothetical protein
VEVAVGRDEALAPCSQLPVCVCAARPSRASPAGRRRQLRARCAGLRPGRGCRVAAHLTHGLGAAEFGDAAGLVGEGARRDFGRIADRAQSAMALGEWTYFQRPKRSMKMPVVEAKAWYSLNTVRSGSSLWARPRSEAPRRFRSAAPRGPGGARGRAGSRRLSASMLSWRGRAACGRRAGQRSRTVGRSLAGLF